MKRIKLLIGTASLLCMMACSNILDEQPRSIYEPGYFKTEQGIMGGLTSMYAHLRYIYGQGYYYNACETSTDEATYAQSADGNFKTADMVAGTAENWNSSNCRTDAIWGPAFSNINTASGIIENATEAGMAESLIAEAYFFRAFDYFLLVQTFGGVPLDLGAGNMKFNSSPSRVSSRNTVPEVYQAIFSDLNYAVENLPESPRMTGSATKTLARLYLSKAYLTFAWWLENPQNIPTYPESARADLDGHDAAWYYQKAYDIAVESIENPLGFGLQPTFYDVNLASNDRNNEILLYADHTQTSELYNASSLSWSNGNAPENFVIWFMTWNYTVIRSSSSNTSWDAVSSVQREAVQEYGRPWTRMCPTYGAIAKTFADKTNDSRYDGTFTTCYRGNWQKTSIGNVSLYNANNMEVKPNDPILTFLDEDDDNIVYPEGAGNSNIGAGELPGRADFVVGPKGISRIVYPGLWKLGPERTDHDQATSLGSPNGASVRPFNIAKFSEFYFIAAEAAVKGATVKTGKSARELINVIRARAGKWSWHNKNNEAKIADNSEAMIAATPSEITIDYILAERSREYYGEGYRIYDLKRTQKWAEVAGSYQICGAAYGNHTLETFNRTIDAHHYLSPIPEGQLSALEMTEEEVKAYQNPGY